MGEFPDEIHKVRCKTSNLYSIPSRVEILLIASCYGNRDKHRPGGPLGSYTDSTFTSTYVK